MKRSHMFFAFFFLALASLLTSCSLTPHANLGVNFHMNDGKLKASPNVNVGVYGRP